MIYAEDRPYWDTTVHPAKSLGEIQELLENFGAGNTLVSQGKAGSRVAWLVRFEYGGRTYRFAFAPLSCRRPQQVYSFSKIRRTAEEQSRYQMGRTAVYFVKAILTAAEANPDALFGFLELPGARPGSVPMTTAELDVQGLTAALPDIELPLLGEGTHD